MECISASSNCAGSGDNDLVGQLKRRNAMGNATYRMEQYFKEKMVWAFLKGDFVRMKQWQAALMLVQK